MLAGRIEIRLHRDGTVSAEMGGMHGQRCSDYLAVLEEVLHAVTIASEDRPEHLSTGSNQLVEDLTTSPRLPRLERDDQHGDHG